MTVLMRRPDHHLYPQVDWNQVESGKYAVVDPNSVADILYLTPREYVITSRVAITSDMVLVVLATPRGDRPKDDVTATSSSDTEPKNSPPRVNNKSRKHHWLFQATDRETRFGRIKHAFESRMLKFADQEIGSKRQLRTTRPGAGKSERANSMIAISQTNLADLTQEWTSLLWFRFFRVKTSRSFSRSVKDLSKHPVKFLVHQAALTLVLRLKIILHCVLAYIAGNPMQNTQELGMWMSLLTARMVVPVRDYDGHGINPIRYARGQPMGALSSWPSMALVHHVLVQFSAFTADKYSAFQTLEFPFRDYMILGDDIIIANEKVAESYKKGLCGSRREDWSTVKLHFP